MDRLAASARPPLTASLQRQDTGPQPRASPPLVAAETTLELLYWPCEWLQEPRSATVGIATDQSRELAPVPCSRHQLEPLLSQLQLMLATCLR